jgi:hypothetical protein
MNTPLLRERVLARLVADLVGPLSANESLADRPTQRYSTGILYPRDTQIEPQEDEDGGLAVNEAEDLASLQNEESVSLHAALKPAAAGLSFAVRGVSTTTKPPAITVEISCATYKSVAVDDSGTEVAGPPPNRAHQRWRRAALSAHLEVEVLPGERRTKLKDHGIEGMELYMLVTPHAGVETVTLALANQRSRGESSAYDEEQHFFQVALSVTQVTNGEFAPRPSRRAQTDEDSRTAALIYRHIKEHVVGHTCSASAVTKNGTVTTIKTDWIPAVVVPRISDRGDQVFERLHLASESIRPLEAAWLAAASPEDLVAGLCELVEVYRSWIAREAAREAGLPVEFRAQAKKHIAGCERGAQRMMEGIHTIRTDSKVRAAFQLAQSAMAIQFRWSREGASLKWRPFQLAFQLLVLASLSDRSHRDREIMDLLWFPTGGGKTEAYLALTAFTIMLRRLRETNVGEGTGVATLMRYTLRLLTVQQFQRAAVMICACELLRRRSQGAGGELSLGREPIGIGLWVGQATTPLTLREALDRPTGDRSTHEQLTGCPCCRSKLNWRVTPRECTVECTSEAPNCEFAQSGRGLPVWTIGEEVYRNTPSLLIGTVDKFAQIVRKQETGVLFGRGSNHAPPDLIIQDELHLISGPLGSMAGLYEVAIDELCRSGAVRPKIIGSTATIRRAEEQILALFDRGTYQFPSPGIDADNSGFAVTDPSSPGRLHVGITTAGRSATYMLQALAATLLQSATDPGGSPEERDYYWTLVAYFNSLRELGRALVLMQDDVPVSIKQFAARRGEEPRRIEAPAELTSRVQSYEIRDMLDRLNKPATDSGAVDLLVASNMISVGMDIPRLGLMIVNAQPKTLSEYIQATSRVGRVQVPGLVITMYNSMRARDRSHFESFETWHRSLYRDIEATSVTPFASRAQDKALHAVLVALVRHLVPGMGSRPVLNDLRRADAERLASVIESRVARVDPAELTAVSQKLKHLLDQWAARPDLQTYWDDFNRRSSLLMSAEQFAAKADVDPDLDTEGAQRALWPTPNSMREVEPGAPFVLRNALRAGE